MRRLRLLLTSLWRLDQLERRVAVLESELALRVAKLEAATEAEFRVKSRASLAMLDPAQRKKPLDRVVAAVDELVRRY